MASQTKNMILNVGPSHPAMHGVIRLITELEGETVVKVEAEIGYMHRAFEKSCENYMLADIVPTFGSINMIAGELDR
jgi:NADH-quinone oxidoreductase subunit D